MWEGPNNDIFLLDCCDQSSIMKRDSESPLNQCLTCCWCSRGIFSRYICTWIQFFLVLCAHFGLQKSIREGTQFTLDSEQAPARHLLELHRTPDQIISPDESTGLEVWVSWKMTHKQSQNWENIDSVFATQIWRFGVQTPDLQSFHHHTVFQTAKWRFGTWWEIWIWKLIKMRNQTVWSILIPKLSNCYLSYEMKKNKPTVSLKLSWGSPRFLVCFGGAF